MSTTEEMRMTHGQHNQRACELMEEMRGLMRDLAVIDEGTPQQIEVLEDIARAATNAANHLSTSYSKTESD